MTDYEIYSLETALSVIKKNNFFYCEFAQKFSVVL